MIPLPKFALALIVRVSMFELFVIPFVTFPLAMSVVISPAFVIPLLMFEPFSTTRVLITPPLSFINVPLIFLLIVKFVISPSFKRLSLISPAIKSTTLAPLALIKLP